MTVEVAELNGDALVDALVLFGEDEDYVDGVEVGKFLFVSPLDLAKLRKRRRIHALYRDSNEHL